MKRTVAMRIGWIPLGWMILMGVLVGCEGGMTAISLNESQSVMDSADNTEAPAELAAIEEEEVLQEATREATTPHEPAATGDGNVTLRNFPFSITLDGIDFLNAVDGAEAYSDTSNSTAYYFLRDRSKTVYEVCGDARYTTAMKAIPDLIYTFFKNDPYLRDDDIFVGLGTFPNKGETTPTVLESLAPIEVDQLSQESWRQALDANWNSAYTDLYDAAVFKHSIAEAVAELNTVAANRKILVVFGDSMLDFPGGKTEWNTIMPNADDLSPLTSILKNQNDDPADDVELHYIQYDCLPDPDDTPLEHRINFWENGIANWQKLQGPDDIIDIDQVDDEPLVVNDHIRVYGWKWYSSVIHQTRVEANLAPPKPPAWHVPSLLNGLIGNFLPATHISDANLWRRQRFIHDPGATEMAIPVPGYAAGITIHMLGFDEAWCPRSGIRYDENCVSGTGGAGTIVYKTFEMSLRPPSDACEGTTITLRPDDFSGTALKYPALVWWEIQPIEFPPIVGEIVDVAYQSDSDSTITVLSRTTIDLYWEWAESLIPEDEDFLNNCYQFDIVPSGTVPDMSAGEFTLPRTISTSFDPGIDPTIGFDLAFDIVVSRKVNAPNFTSVPYVSTETEMLIGSEIGMPVAHFQFTPTLQNESVEFKVSPSDITYIIPVLYTGSEYYPDGSAPEAPKIYLLRPEIATTTENDCQASPDDSEIIYMRETEIWAAISLREGIAEPQLLGNRAIIEPSESSGSFWFTFVKKEVYDCGYEYLLIHWDNDGFTPIACNLRMDECEQSSAFTLPARNELVMRDEQ